ncbi:MAG: glycosyl hydrolase [Planctomycetota bacterium]
MRISRHLPFSTICLALIGACPMPSLGAEEERSPIAAMKFRSIGPALMSGRISDLALDPVKPNTWYAAVGSGGVFKTVNAGTTWTPIFDDYGSYSIGCVTIDPSDRHTIWVGTGEAVGGRHVGYGDGVYVSHDGGGSFKRVGLEATEHIAKIIVHPSDSNTVFVAAQGPLWSKGGERGLYKTTNGGKSWRCVLSKGPYTGVTDIVMDPSNAEVLYAATHQRHRTVWALLNAGPESGVFKSTDGGESWGQLKRGLPGEDLGKIALGVSPHTPNVVYASIELAGLSPRRGGFFRSTDGGASWTKQSDFISGGTGPHYYQEMWVDPHREGVIYQADVRLARSEDDGKTWGTAESSGKHVDNHAVAFHPTDPDFLLVGCDGGVYRSYDRGANYLFAGNLPLTQFYKIDVGNGYPIYHVVGGTQDNDTQYGPTRTLNASGIRNADWRVTIGGDGHDCAIDPKDPNVIYCESQQGYLRRFDPLTGQAVDIRPQPEPGEPEFRFNWDSPVLISPHSHTRIYFGSNHLHRSDDRGDSWKTISPDLSRQRNRFKLEMMDRVWSIDAAYDLYAMSHYGNLTSISESPLVENLIYVGTDDGLLHVTDDGGENWREITPEYGLPDEAFVNDVKADRHDPNTVYAVFDAHKVGDFAPYIFKSTDRGKTWNPIVGDLPDRHIVWRFEQDHEVADLCFLGTEFGIFASVDGGQKWTKFSRGLPSVPFRDLAIQRRENDLVGASFGRGIYVLDDYSPLREIAKGAHREPEVYVFPIRDAQLYEVDGGREGRSSGEAVYRAENPPFGAVITYHVKAEIKTLREKRKEAERAAKAEGLDTEIPSVEQMEREENEEAPAIFFTITDAEGGVVARLSGKTSRGLHRLAWNLRYSSFQAARRESDGPRGPYVLPGEYRVQAAKRVKGETTDLGEPVAVQVVEIGETALPKANPAETLAFQKEVGRLSQSLSAIDDLLDRSRDELAAIKTALTQARVPTDAMDTEVRRLETELRAIRRQLEGDPIKRRLYEPAERSIAARLGGARRGARGRAGPTSTHRREYELAKAGIEALLPKVQALRSEDLENLKKQLDEAGVPWSRGRVVPPIPGNDS